jgi:hypothetical protein
LLTENQINDLTATQVNLLHLIARNCDVGFMGLVHNLVTNYLMYAEAHRILLAKTISSLNQVEFDDAKFQFAVCCKKIKEQLLKCKVYYFCRDPNEYTKICALKPGNA